MLNEIEKLDLVIKHMASQYPQSFAEKKGVLANQILEIHPEVQIEGVDFSAEMHFILEKLLQDGYVTKDYVTGQTWPFYAITFDGAYFIKYMGGYQGLQNQRTAENTRLSNIEKELRANRNWTLWLTIVLTVGTVAQAAYAIVKLYWENGWFRF